MRNIKAVFLKQIIDTVKNKAVLIQFLMFPIMAVIMENSIMIPDMPEHFFAKLFSVMFTGMAPLTCMSAIISEEKESNTLRALMMSSVKPWQYLIGTGAYVFYHVHGWHGCFCPARRIQRRGACGISCRNGGWHYFVGDYRRGYRHFRKQSDGCNLADGAGNDSFFVCPDAVDVQRERQKGCENSIHPAAQRDYKRHWQLRNIGGSSYCCRSEFCLGRLAVCFGL